MMGIEPPFGYLAESEGIENLIIGDDPPEGKKKHARGFKGEGWDGVLVRSIRPENPLCALRFCLHCH